MNLAKRIALFAALIVVAASCTPEPKGEAADVSEAVSAEQIETTTGEAIAVNTTTSVIDWIGTKVRGQHTGTIKLSEGELIVDNGNITGGSFTIDMNTIAVTDLEGEKKEWLEGHLKGLDEKKKDHFFNVNEYPTANFQITNVEAIEGNDAATHKVKGNLTMKNISKSVSFDAKVEASEGVVKATTPNFTIDRTLWKIMYNAKATLSAEQIKEGFIHDEISLAITLEAGTEAEAASDEATE